MVRPAAQAPALDAEIALPALTARQILVFLVVSLALLMASIDSTIVAVGIPDMMRGLQTNVVWIGWVLTGYTLTQTIIMPLAGKLSDDFGRKRLFLGAVALFTVSSFLCSIAPNVYLLILFRVSQAIGGGAFMPSAVGIISDVFGPQRRGTAIGLFTSVFPLGGIIGPNIGGWVIDRYSWREIFSINVPIGIVLLALGVLFLPTVGRLGEQRSIDLVGALSFAIGISAIMYGMTVWGNQIVFGFQVALWIAAGVALLVFFLYHEGRARDPMIDLRLLKQHAFFATNLYSLLYGALVFAFFSFMPLYATLEYGMSATAAGFILTPRAIAMMVMSLICSFLLIRFGYRLPMILGMVLVSLCLLLVSQGWHQPTILGAQVDDLLLLSALIAIGGFGVGISGPASSNAALDLMPEAVARITGLRGMFRTTGGVLGTAVIVLVLAHEPDQAAGLERIFRIMGFLVLLIIPTILLIPDHARARRRGHRAPPE